MREEADKRLTRTHAPLIQTWSVTGTFVLLRSSLKSSFRTCPLQLSERSCRSCEQRERHFSVSIILNCRRDVLFRDSNPTSLERAGCGYQLD